MGSLPNILKFVSIIIIFASWYKCQGFTVTPKSEDIFVLETEDSVFNYIIAPWPPPYRDNPDYVQYEHVVLTFLDKTQPGVPIPLCEVIYNKGAFDENSGNCTLWDERMYPYDPSTPNGAYFSFFDTNYTLDRGEYNLLIEYGSPSVNSSIMLEVLVPAPAPSITATPNDEVEVGELVVLECQVNKANPPADLRWSRGQWEDIAADEYTKSDSYDDYTTSKIQITSQKSDHGQAYICWASNEVSESEISASHSISVVYDPEVKLLPCNTDQSTKYRIEEGKNARFDCKIDANPYVHLIEWEWALAGDDMNKIEDYNDTFLVVSNVMRDKEGSTVRCMAESSRAADSSPCTVEVQYGPEVTIPDEQALDEGDTLLVDCTSDANPDAHTYAWTRQDHPDFHQDGKQLNLTKVGTDDAGVYICEAHNTLNPTDSHEQDNKGLKAMHVHVKYAPKLEEYALTKFAGTVDESAILVCDVAAYPYVSMEWRKDNKILAADEHRNISQVESKGYLEIYEVNDGDFGAYECKTHNEKGVLTVDLSLLLPGTPDAPQYCETVDITDSDVTFLCVPGYDGGETVTSYTQVERRNEGDKKYSDSTLSTDENGQYLIKVENLGSNTEYIVYLYTENIHGRSANYYKTEIKTEDGPGSSNPSNSSNNVGIIIGATMALFIILSILVGLGLVVFWKYSLEPSCAAKAQERCGVYYENLPKSNTSRCPSTSEDTAAYDNKAYMNEKDERLLATYNEYVQTPGMIKQSTQNWQQTNHEPTFIDNNRANEAHEQRRGQNSLAGVGALTYNSQQNLHMQAPNAALIVSTKTVTQTPPANTEQQDVRSKVRLPPIGACAESQRWELPRKNITLKQKLGEGAFGEVWRGKAEGLFERTGTTTVAVKFADENCAVEEERALLKELHVMQNLDSHINIIQLYGCCTFDGPVYIVMEYAGNGNLQQFLRNNRATGSFPNTQNISTTLSSRDLTVFALHVASGMEFISSKRYLHRDLAARNVLLDKHLTCKIGDFGLARDIINCRQYESTTQRRLPIRWMAPESLFDSIYSTKSDVWAFGVLLWEIVTLGATPYPGMAGSEIAELIQRGFRMEKPKHCSPAFYAVMQDCWAQEPQMRPLFTSIRESLEAILYDLEHNPVNDIRVEEMRDNMLGIVRTAPGEKC